MKLLSAVISTTLAATISFPLYAQTVDKSHDVQPFKELKLAGCFDAKIVPGAANKVKVTATARQQDMLTVEQKGGDLKIEESKHGLCNDGPVKVEITTTFAPTDKVELALRGSGDLEADVVNVKELEVDLKGSGNATVKGTTAACSFDIAGSGNIEAPALVCDRADVDIKGSGNVKLASTKELGVEIKGSGNVQYAGQPTLKKVDIKGSGRLEKL